MSNNKKPISIEWESKNLDEIVNEILSEENSPVDYSRAHLLRCRAQLEIDSAHSRVFGCDGKSKRILNGYLLDAASSAGRGDFFTTDGCNIKIVLPNGCVFEMTISPPTSQKGVL